MAKSRPRCATGDFRRRWTFSKSTYLGWRISSRRLILPPQHALLAFDAFGVGEWLCHAVILTRETADDHVDSGMVVFPSATSSSTLAMSSLTHDPSPKCNWSAAPRELPCFLACRFPLIGPYRFKRTGWFHIETVSRVSVSIQAKAETSDTGKAFRQSVFPWPSILSIRTNVL